MSTPLFMKIHSQYKLKKKSRGKSKISISKNRKTSA